MTLATNASKIRRIPARSATGCAGLRCLCSARSSFEQFVDHGLIGLLALAGEAAETREEARVDANGDELFGVGRFGAADAAGAFELGVGGFRNVGEINPGVRNRPRAFCGSPGAR